MTSPSSAFLASLSSFFSSGFLSYTPRSAENGFWSFWSFEPPSHSKNPFFFFCSFDFSSFSKSSSKKELISSLSCSKLSSVAPLINEKTFSGWAFGFGIERVIMMKYGLDDIRNYYSGDIRFLEQF